MRSNYIILARKYRPQNFDEVIGQIHVTQTLKNAVETGRIAHAYLFSGPRGVGKTTIERILAKCLNCETGPTSKPCGKCIFCQEITEGNSIDVLEIDGASNRGIDEVRDLREKVKFSPGMSRYKVYIIDEVHMLTTEAFNALLKTLEEPPEHVIFVLGTTAPHRLPQTILSRCQWFALKRISVQDIIRSLRKISEVEGIKISENSLYAIARHAEGSLRDAQVSLDQIISFSDNDVKDEDVNALLGIIRLDFFHNFIKGIIDRDVHPVIKLIGELVESGYEVEDFIKGLEEYLRNLIVLKDGTLQPKEVDFTLVDLPREEVKRQKEESTLFAEEELVWMLDTVSQTQKDLRLFGMRGQERLILELMAIRLIKRDIELKIGTTEKGILGTKVPAKEKPSEKKPDIKTEVQHKEVLITELPETKKITGETHAQKFDIEDVKKKWSEVIEIMKKRKISLAHFLKECTPNEIKEDVIVANFGKNVMFQKERAELRENRNTIEEVLSKVYGRKFKINFQAENKPEVNQSVNQPQPDSSSMDAIVKKVIELFNAKVIEKKTE